MEGAELKAWRERFGLTQEQLATALGVAPNTVARWEREERDIPPTQPILLAILERYASGEIDEIMVKLDDSRAKYYGATKNTIAERQAADKKLLAAISKSLKALETWEEQMQTKIEQVYVSEQVSVPKRDDPAWALIRKTKVWNQIASLRNEKAILEEQVKN